MIKTHKDLITHQIGFSSFHFEKHISKYISKNTLQNTFRKTRFRIKGPARYSEQLRTLITSERVEIWRLCLWRELRLIMPFYVPETSNQSSVPSQSFSRKTLKISRSLRGTIFQLWEKIPETFFPGSSAHFEELLSLRSIRIRLS